MVRCRFYSDTNQAHFEDALDRAGIGYARAGYCTLLTDEPADWICDLVRELGGDLEEVEE